MCHKLADKELYEKCMSRSYHRSSVVRWKLLREGRDYCYCILLIRSNDEDIVCCTGINVYECFFKFWDRLADACVGSESMDLFWKTI